MQLLLEKDGLFRPQGTVFCYRIDENDFLQRNRLAYFPRFGAYTDFGDSHYIKIVRLH